MFEEANGYWLLAGGSGTGATQFAVRLPPSPASISLPALPPPAAVGEREMALPPTATPLPGGRNMRSRLPSLHFATVPGRETQSGASAGAASNRWTTFLSSLWRSITTGLKLADPSLMILRIRRVPQRSLRSLGRERKALPPAATSFPKERGPMHVQVVCNFSMAACSPRFRF